MATSVNGLQLRRTFGRDHWRVPVPFGPDGWRMVRADGTASVIVTVAWQDDGHEWVHASIAGQDMPTYEDLVTLRDAVFRDGWAFEVYAPPAAHINIHPRARHLWGRLDGTRVHPDFGSEGTI